MLVKRGYILRSECVGNVVYLKCKVVCGLCVEEIGQRARERGGKENGVFSYCEYWCWGDGKGLGLWFEVGYEVFEFDFDFVEGFIL